MTLLSNDTVQRVKTSVCRWWLVYGIAFMLVQNAAMSQMQSSCSRKCRIGISAQLLNQWNNLSESQKLQLHTAIRQTTAQCDTVIGHFHFYYDTSGTNTPALLDANNTRVEGTAKEYVDSAGAIFNHVWDVEINELGFLAPPLEVGQTGYPITIQDCSGLDEYGETDLLALLPNDSIRYYTAMIVDNDFSKAVFSTKGMPALEVTAAHEFHHAIQLGSYACRIISSTDEVDERYAYEMTSVFMESYVYPAVHDYYQYLPDFFSLFNGQSLYAAGDGGYERVVWMQFLAKRFDVGIIKTIWNHMPAERYIESIRDAIAEHGSMLHDEFAQFAYWNYFTADRADTSKSYLNGANYPRFTPAQVAAYANPFQTISSGAEPLSISMYNFVDGEDTLTSILVNTDMSAALQRDETSQSIAVELSANLLPAPYQLLSNGLYAGYSAEYTNLWRTFYLHSAGHSDIPSTNLAATPNPFNMEQTNRLVLPVPNEPDAMAAVSFVSSSLNSVFNQQLSTSMEFGKRSIVVPTSLIKSKLSSGIYFVIATVHGNTYKWKVAVIK